MKFLCANCKAKYQIADEKIQGRTLRMKCRRCEHDIAIKGDEMVGAVLGSQAGPLPARPASARPPAPGTPVRPPGRGGSAVGPPPARLGSRQNMPASPAPTRPSAGPKPQGSALGAEFRKQVAHAPPEMPQRSTVLDQWHVAIHDVPVGPMKREEISRKIQSGAVTGESLAWREGFDDWRPLRDIAELSPLLRKPTTTPAIPVGSPLPRSGGAPSPRTGFGPRPPTQRTGSPGARPGSRPPTRPEMRPAARSNVVPIGGRLGASAASSMEDDPFAPLPELDAGEPTRVAAGLPFDLEGAAPQEDILGGLGASSSAGAVAAPQSAAQQAAPISPAALAAPILAAPAAPAPAQRRSMPVGAWIAIVGAGAFGIALAIVVSVRFLSPPQVVQAPQSTQPQPNAPLTPQQAVAMLDPEGLDQPPEGPTADVPEPGGTEPGATSAAHPRTGPAAARPAVTPPPVGATKTTKVLTPEQRALLERMGVGSQDTVGNIQVADNVVDRPRAGASSGPLTADQLRTVVTRNRPQLQSCLELAARRVGSTDQFRVDVTVSIGMSGTVTSVTTGGGIGDAGACIQRAVRRWRFPAAGEVTTTAFPVIFAPQ